MAKRQGADILTVQNAVKTLLANISFSSVDNPIRSLVVTSSVPDEGKTTIAINLAKAAASGGRRVLLVECDMRRRSLAGMMGVHPSAGLYAVLSEQVPLHEAVVPALQENMFFLDAEPHIPSPVDILSSKRFGRLVGMISREFDLVIFDTPPLGGFVDAAVLSTLADGTALVVRDNFTKRDEVLAAYDQLKKAEANVVGVVMNYCEGKSDDYYYSSRYRSAEQVAGVEEFDFDPSVLSAPANHGAGRHGARR